MQEKVADYIRKMKDMTAQERIAFAYQEFGQEVVFASSFGEEDQVILDMIAAVAPGLAVFTLDTGRLFQETYDLMARTQEKYGLPLKVYYPETAALEDMVARHGINLFYRSVELRKLCCRVRKVDPLRRALGPFKAWICGLRRAQSVTRTDIDVAEWDAANRKIKINPLVDWDLRRLQTYIQEHNVEVNPLHRQGFLSIGCACCTRAVQEGEDIRAGRWWWEDPEKKECGLHQRVKAPAGDKIEGRDQ